MNWGSNDIGEENLAWALANSPSPQLLRNLVDLSRSRFGWFSKCSSRAFEYPWVFREIGNAVDKRILDIGTGVSPLPLLLAESGAKVVTVDSSPVSRELGNEQDTWTEWGYFDYACLNSSIASVNRDILSARLESRAFDCIYSVSVVEHLKASVRHQLWHKAEQWLTTSGVLLLTVDLFPGTDRLWNYNMSKLVEPGERHGDLAALTRELAEIGLDLRQQTFLRGLRDSRTDVALLRFAKSADKPTGHMREKYTSAYFLGGIDSATSKPYGVLGHQEFRTGKIHVRLRQEFAFTQGLVDTLVGKDVLDIGFGRGDLIPLFLDAGVNSYTGLDFSRHAVEIASKRHEDPRVRLSHVAATELDAERAFDLVLLLDTIEHIPVYEMDVVWPKLYRALRPRGHVVIGTPTFVNPNSIDHSDKIPAVSGMHCHKQTWGTLVRACLRHGFAIARAEDERLLGLIRREDLPLFDRETRAQYLAAQSALLVRSGVENFAELTPAIERKLVPGAGRILMGCVVDNDTKYYSQALRLLQSVRWFGGDVAGVNFFVCIVGDPDLDFVREYQQLGAFVRSVLPFDPRHPHSNKLRLLELPECQAYDTVILLDCDTIVVQDPSRCLDGVAFQAKMADWPSIPHEKLEQLFEHFDMESPDQDRHSNPSGKPMSWYCNAGVLVFPHGILSDFGGAWQRLNRALLDRLDLLEPHTLYCDQASLSLAYGCEPVPFRELPLSMNFPAHFERLFSLPAMQACDPIIIHYHDRVNADGYLGSVPCPGAQERIQQFNRRLGQERRGGLAHHVIRDAGRIHHRIADRVERTEWLAAATRLCRRIAQTAMRILRGGSE